MSGLEKIDIDILLDDIKKELIDFYEYLILKHDRKQSELRSPIKDKRIFLNLLEGIL